MDQLLSIFTQIGVDNTLGIQFALFVVGFFILKPLLFSKLQFVLEQRDSKTHLMEKEANKKLEDSERLAKTLKVKLDQAHEVAQSNIRNKREELLSKSKAMIVKRKQELSQQYETQMIAFEKDLATKRKDILNESESLSNELINKLVKN
jgi:F-type H+-transporting ATPase subunit b